MNDAAKYYTYEDADLQMQLPAFLRPIKRGRHFVARRSVNRSRDITILGVNFLTDEGADSLKFNLMNVQLVDSAGVTRQIIRRGISPFIAHSVEALGCDRNSINKTVIFDYELVFKLTNRYVHVRASGKDCLETFDEICGRIVRSIKLKRAAFNSK